MNWHKYNRNKSKSNRKGKFWCWGCDAYLIHPGQKCPKCGKKDTFKNIKKSRFRDEDKEYYIF